MPRLFPTFGSNDCKLLMYSSRLASKIALDELAGRGLACPLILEFTSAGVITKPPKTCRHIKRVSSRRSAKSPAFAIPAVDSIFQWSQTNSSIALVDCGLNMFGTRDGPWGAGSVMLFPFLVHPFSEEYSFLWARWRAAFGQTHWSSSLTYPRARLPSLW